MSGRAFVAAVACAAALAHTSDARAQSPSPSSPFGRVPTATAPPPPAAASTGARAPADAVRSLRGRFGLDVAERLVASPQLDDRLRGIARAASIGSPEAVALLARLATTGDVRADARALLDLTRALALFVDQSSARSALAAVLTAQAMVPPVPRQGARAARDVPDDSEQALRVSMARKVAALALGEASFKPGVDPLVNAARTAGVAQPAALFGLALTRPSDMPLLATGALSPPLVRLFAEVGDLRVLDAIRAAARSLDPPTRAAALTALGDLRDFRAIETARGLLGDADPRVRVAATEALVALDATDKGKAVEALLLAQDGTALAGARLAERAQSDGIVRALAARAVASSDPDMRAAAVLALGRQTSADAVTVLRELSADPMLTADVAGALGRSAAPGVQGVLETMSANGAGRRLALRAYVLRALVRGERSAVLDRAANDVATSREPRDRPLGVFVQVALGTAPLGRALADDDPRVRRAAAMAAYALGDDATAALLARFVIEPDALTRALLAPVVTRVPRSAPLELDALVTTQKLVERLDAGGPDAPLAAFVLAARLDDDPRAGARIATLLASRDPVLRAHVARGLGRGHAADAVGRLAAAYRYEVDPQVRRAIVRALAERDDAAPERVGTLTLAARFDTDRATRSAAARALDGLPPVATLLGPMDVALLRVVTVDGEGRLPPLTGAVLRADGFVAPVAFDDDGFVLLPGTPPGDARLILAPRLTSYEAPPP